MKKLVFASNNAHKLSEIRAILGDRIEIISLSDLQCHEEIPETADTLEGNALIKARYVWEHYGLYCFADDTGLEVEALGGAPGASLGSMPPSRIMSASCWSASRESLHLGEHASAR